MHKGKKVVQGEVIGYVGSTGYSTGPHLDFRMKRHGKYLNPLTVESPSGEPIPKTELQAFQTRIAPLVAALQENEQIDPEKNGVSLASVQLDAGGSAY